MYLLTAMGLTAEATKEDPKTLQQVTTVYNGGPLCLGTNAFTSPGIGGRPPPNFRHKRRLICVTWGT